MKRLVFLVSTICMLLSLHIQLNGQTKLKPLECNLKAPENFTASPQIGSNPFVNLSWENVEDNNGYTVYLYTVSKKLPLLTKQLIKNSTKTTINNLALNTDYIAKIVAKCKNGRNRNISEVKFTTSTCNLPAPAKIQSFGNVIVWTPVTSAKGYAVTLRDTLGGFISKTIVMNPTFTVTPLSQLPIDVIVAPICKNKVESPNVIMYRLVPIIDEVIVMRTGDNCNPAVERPLLSSNQKYDFTAVSNSTNIMVEINGKDHICLEITRDGSNKYSIKVNSHIAGLLVDDVNNTLMANGWIIYLGTKEIIVQNSPTSQPISYKIYQQ